MKCAIIGTGNIGLDLYYKLTKIKLFEEIVFFNRNPNSKGSKFCKKNRIKFYSDGVKNLKKQISSFEIIFDATSATGSIKTTKLLDKLIKNKYYINLTPSKIGEYLVPYKLKGKLPKKINLITCGGQSTIPVISELKKKLKKNLASVELVSSISSISAGKATRENVDEYLNTTESAIASLCKIKKTKVILNLNPSIPPVNMMNSIFFELKKDINQKVESDIRKIISNINKNIKKFIPEYNIKFFKPLKNKIIRITIRVVGQGDYLPTYAGNLDIITSAAAQISELIYEKENNFK
tara:strand:+ start:225 stop:1106 length:882 start_codon:yes stop_codon:yes gene_type:complete